MCIVIFDALPTHFLTCYNCGSASFSFVNNAPGLLTKTNKDFSVQKSAVNDPSHISGLGQRLYRNVVVSIPFATVFGDGE